MNTVSHVMMKNKLIKIIKTMEATCPAVKVSFLLVLCELLDTLLVTSHTTKHVTTPSTLEYTISKDREPSKIGPPWPDSPAKIMYILLDSI